jgi:hypothetical protein
MTLTAAKMSAKVGDREAVICASKGLGKPGRDNSVFSVKHKAKNQRDLLHSILPILN